MEGASGPLPWRDTCAQASGGTCTCTRRHRPDAKLGPDALPMLNGVFYHSEVGHLGGVASKHVCMAPGQAVAPPCIMSTGGPLRAAPNARGRRWHVTCTIAWTSLRPASAWTPTSRRCSRCAGGTSLPTGSGLPLPFLPMRAQGKADNTGGAGLRHVMHAWWLRASTLSLLCLMTHPHRRGGSGSCTPSKTCSSSTPGRRPCPPAPSRFAARR